MSVLFLLVGMRLLATHSDDLAHGIARFGESGLAHDRQRLGNGVTLPPAAHRPRITITADHARTVHRVGTTPYLFDGNRFFGVRLTIHNKGKRPWVSEPGTTYQVMDISGVPHAGGTAIRIREGRMLPDPLRIPAGGTVRGYVVFQLPADQPVTGASITVGPGRPSTATWTIERQ